MLALALCGFERPNSIVMGPRTEAVRHEGVVVRGALVQPLVVGGVGGAIVKHLERANDPPRVVGVDERGALGVP